MKRNMLFALAVLLIVGLGVFLGAGKSSLPLLAVAAVPPVAGAAGKKRLPAISQEEMKIFDDLTKPDWAEVYKDLFVSVVSASGQYPGTAQNWAQDARERRNKLYPESANKGKKSGSGATDSAGRLSFKSYTALTALSAHSGGMPQALFEKYPEDLRKTLLDKKFVELADARAKITQAGDDALTAYEKNVMAKSQPANAGSNSGNDASGAPAQNAGSGVGAAGIDNPAQPSSIVEDAQGGQTAIDPNASQIGA